MAELWREIPAQPLKSNIDNSNNNHYQIKKLSKTRCLFFSLFLTDAPSGGRSKNGYVFQEMGV